MYKVKRDVKEEKKSKFKSDKTLASVNAFTIKLNNMNLNDESENNQKIEKVIIFYNSETK